MERQSFINLVKDGAIDGHRNYGILDVYCMEHRGKWMG